METTQTSQPVQTSIPLEPAKVTPKKSTAITIAVVGGIALFVGLFFNISTASTKVDAEAYMPQSPVAEQEYRTWSIVRDRTECEKQQLVARANMADVSHGVDVPKWNFDTLKEKSIAPCPAVNTQQTF